MGHLEYGEFKERLLAELKDFYGRDAAVEIKKVTGNNGKGYDGLHVILKGREGNAVPVLGAEMLYGAYICSAGTWTDVWRRSAGRRRGSNVRRKSGGWQVRQETGNP